MRVINELYKVCEDFDRGQSPKSRKWLKTIQEAYVKGSKEVREEYPYRHPLVHEKSKKIKLKRLQHRDNQMLSSIERDLKTKGKSRSFYAVGCAHLFDDYENLLVKLKKKGWTIVDAYQSKKANLALDLQES